MNLKFIKLSKYYQASLQILFFLILLKLNQTFFEYNSSVNTIDSFIYYLGDYLVFFITKFYKLELLVFLFLLIPGVVLLRSKFSFTNLTVLLFYIFFFSPFILLFFIQDTNFYRSFTLKQISINQKEIYLLTFVMYLNLIFLIFLSKLKFNYKFKHILLDSKKTKLTCLIIILFFIILLINKIYNFEEKINLDLNFFFEIESLIYRNFLSGFFGYFYYFLIFVLLPLFFLLEKKKFDLFIITFFYLLFFIIFKTKINLIIIFSILIQNLYFYYFKKIQLNFFLYILYFLIFSLIGSILLDFKYNFFTTLYFERFFLSQTKNLLLFYDFFKFNEPIYLSHIRFFDYSYPFEKNLYDLIRDLYGGGSATSNTYIMDGFASFGIIGLFFPSILIIIITKFIDNLIDFQNTDFFVIYLFQIFGFISFPLSTHFLTYGLGATILLSMIKFKK